MTQRARRCYGCDGCGWLPVYGLWTVEYRLECPICNGTGRNNTTDNLVDGEQGNKTDG